MNQPTFNIKNNLKEIEEMKAMNLLKNLLPVAAFLLLAGPCAQAQTLRGDFNMDGEIDVSDVSSMIDFLLTGSTGEVTEADRDTIFVEDIPIVMVKVEGGVYCNKIGDTAHAVDDFWIAQTEVTQKLWKIVMDLEYPIYPWDDWTAMMQFTWYDCQDFIAKLNEKTGRNFRLPKRYEWHYAAAGGRLTKGYLYSGSDNIDEVAWYIGNSNNNDSRKVASKAPNELGLYDMSGNVQEWCQDSFPADTTGVDASLIAHWLANGSSFQDAVYCETTFGFFMVDNTPQSIGGMRLAF